MSMNLKKYIIIILLSLMIVGCGKKDKEKTSAENISREKPADIYFNIKNNVDVYSDITLFDLLEDTNAKVLSDDFKIDTNKIGIKSYKIYYEAHGNKFVYEMLINIVDTEEPIIYSGSTKTIELNYKDDLCDLIMYGDYYDNNPTCIVTGVYDTSKIGTYEITYVITDSSNNITSRDITLKVVKKIESTPVSNDKLYFEDVVKKYKSDNVEFGIDVSKWQGEIDFEAVKSAGATFVMMRMGVQVEMLGEINFDAYYEQNIKNAKAAGLKVGVYLYTKATSVEEVKKHALWVIKELNGLSLELPIVFDWEIWSKWNSLNLSFYDINEISNTFIKTAIDNGYEGMLYSSKNKLETIWENKNDYPVWLAHYTDETNYEGDYIMWQLSSIGRISGINGAVDIDILYK